LLILVAYSVSVGFSFVGYCVRTLGDAVPSMPKRNALGPGGPEVPTAQLLFLHHIQCLLFRFPALVVAIYCAGMVISGSLSAPPASLRVKKNMITVSARLLRRSPLSIQNQ